MARCTDARARTRRSVPTSVDTAGNQQVVMARAMAESTTTSPIVPPGARNCGMSATKNMAALGLSALHSRPSRNADHRLFPADPCPGLGLAAAPDC
jgi:hypothetical protein